MKPLEWITFLLLLILPNTVSEEAQCDGSHTKLLLLVDVRHDPSLTVTRIKNIASYFMSKVKYGHINILDISLVDPFEEKTLINLNNVTSSIDLCSFLDQINQTYLDSDGRVEFLYNQSHLSLAVALIHKKISNETFKTFTYTKYVVIFLSGCFGICKDLDRSLVHIYSSKIKIIFLFNIPLNEDINLYNKENRYASHDMVFINSKDDFTKYNPVISVLCLDCNKGQTKYVWSGHRVSCYWIKHLEKPFSWLEAARMCASERSSLPAIETIDELQFLGELLQNNTIKTRDVNESIIRNTEVVNVGIFKKQGLQQNNIMWLNSRPFNIEVNLEQSKDTKERCVTANYFFKTINETVEGKWKTINCYQPNSKLLVCEIKVMSASLDWELFNKIVHTKPLQTIDFKRFSKLDQLVKLNYGKLNKGEGIFSCHDNYDTTVLYSFVCDGAKDCDNGRDEQYCQTAFSNAKKSEIFCVGNNTTMFYILSGVRCDMIQDCQDNSDEQGCNECLGRQCEDGTCVPSHWLSRDHEECHLFIGTNRNWYLNVSYPCKDQCFGIVNFHHEITFCNVNIKNSSERQTFHVNRSNDEWAPKCLYMRGSDGSTTGCHNNRHLRDCRTFQCPEGFLKCPDSYCVPVYNFLDKQNDCPYGEDELHYSHFLLGRSNNIFQCLESDIFIHNVHLCDGVPQCPYDKDESYCNKTCPPDFQCIGQAVWVVNQASFQVLNLLNTLDLKTKYLNLSGVNLSAMKRTFILENLLEIHASNCNLEDLRNIDYFLNKNKNIYTLNLSYNKLKKIPYRGPISFLQNLQFLNLSNNRNLSTIKIYRIKSKVLQSLDLSFTQISVLELNISEFKSLRSLNLIETNIVQIYSLPKIKRLEYFNLQKTLLSSDDITKILKSVSVTTSLYVDDFKYCCPQISGAGTPRHACHAPPEAFSSCEDLLSDVLKRSLLWLVAGVSLAGNIIVVTYRLFYDRVFFKNGYNVFVTNLSMSDCVMGMYLFIIASTDIRYRDEYVLHESDWRHSSLCQAAGFLSTLSSETSTFFVFLITLDRYLVIRFPFGDHMFTKLGLVLSVLFVWIIGFILASVPLMYSEWKIYSSNGMCLGLPLDISQNLGWHYSFGILICVNFSMFVFIACGQLFIFRSLLSSKRFEMTNVKSIARRVQDINIANQLFFVALSNFMCWFPICVLGFLTLTGHEVSPDTYAWLVVFVMPLNAAINPMIYTIPVIYRKWKSFKEGKSSITQ